MIPVGTLCIIVSTSPRMSHLLGTECEVVGHCDYWSAGKIYRYTHKVRLRNDHVSGITREALLPITPPPRTVDTPKHEPVEA